MQIDNQQCDPGFSFYEGVCTKTTYGPEFGIGGPFPTLREYDVDGAHCVEQLNIVPSHTTCTKPPNLRKADSAARGRASASGVDKGTRK